MIRDTIRNMLENVDHNMYKLLFKPSTSFDSLYFQSTPRYSKTIEYLLNCSPKSYVRNNYTCAGMYRPVTTLYVG